MPTINTQNAVMEAYDNAFNLTCILVREPRGNSPAYNIGYHDDSFVHITFIYQADVGDLPGGAITLAVRLKNPLPNGDPVVFANANPDPPAPGWQRIGTYNRTPVIRPIVSHSVSAGQTIQIKVTATDPDGDAPAFSATGERYGAREEPSDLYSPLKGRKRSLSVERMIMVSPDKVCSSVSSVLTNS